MGTGHRTRNAVFKKLGKTGREVNLPETLEGATDSIAGSLQPGGLTFVKPTTAYPIGEAKGTPEGAKGMPVSGRCWKLDCKRKSSMAVAGKLIRKSWEDKMATKAIQQAIKDKEKVLIQARVDEKRKKKQEREDRKKKKEANQLKGAAVQTLSTSTVRKMSRKDLRSIRKMDVDTRVINPEPIIKTKGLKGKVKV